MPSGSEVKGDEVAITRVAIGAEDVGRGAIKPCAITVSTEYKTVRPKRRQALPIFDILCTLLRYFSLTSHSVR
jgi:hypothetical protein